MCQPRKTARTRRDGARCRSDRSPRIPSSARRTDRSRSTSWSAGTSSQTTCRRRKRRARSAVSATIRSAAITRRTVGPASGSSARRSPETTSGRRPGSPVRSTNRAPRRSASALPTPRAPLPGAPTNTTSMTRPTMPRRPTLVRPRPCRHDHEIPLDRRLRFRKIGPCPTLWNGSAHQCHRSSSRGWRPRHEHTVHSGHGRAGGPRLGRRVQYRRRSPSAPRPRPRPAPPRPASARRRPRRRPRSS